MQSQINQFNYYGRKYVFWNIFNSCKNREVSVLPLLRGCQIRSEDEFYNILELTNWHIKKLNLYMNISKTKNIPNFTFNLKERSKETIKWFTETFNKNSYETDLFFDFDSGDLKEVLKDVETLKEYLESFEVPYHILFSGNKGVHVVIDGVYIENEKIEDGNVYPHKWVVENIKETLGLETLDLANNGLIQRLRKVPYSLVMPKGMPPETAPESLLRVVLPLSDEQLKVFKVEDSYLINVLKRVQIMNRGILERFEDLDQSTKKENVKKFIKQFNFN